MGFLIRLLQTQSVIRLWVSPESIIRFWVSCSESETDSAGLTTDSGSRGKPVCL